MNKVQQVVDILEASMQPAAPEQPEVAVTGQAPEVEVEETEILDEGQEVEVPETPEEEVEEEQPLAAEEQEYEDDGVAIDTLSDLATAIEVDPEFLYGIQVPIGDDGSLVPIAELKDVYKDRSDQLDAERTQLEQERATIEQQRAEIQAQATQGLAQATQMSEELLTAEADMRAIAQQYNQFDWTTLEQNDPGRAALMKQNMATEYSQAQAKVQGLRQKAQDDYTRQMNEVRQAENEQALKRIPAWKNPETKQKDMIKMSELLAKYGFTDQEMALMFDHRVFHMVHDFMQTNGVISTATEAKKTVRKAPKVLRPGAKRAQPNARQKLQPKLDAAKKSRDINTKTAAVSDLLKLNNVRAR